MNEVKVPLKRSILAGIALLLVSLCVAVGVLQYFSIRHTFYQSYQDYIGNVLRYTASNIDVDDLARCIETGEESETFKRLQAFLDNIKDNIDLEYLYVIIPLNAEPVDNIQNVIAAVSRDEYENKGDQLVHLNQMAGASYSPATAQKYLDAYQTGELSYFVEGTEEWGTALTGLMPLYDSAGSRVAALCVDIDVSSIHNRVTEHLLNTCLIIVTIGLLFASVFIVWADRSILRPIRLLEKGVVRVTQQSHDPRDPDAIVLRVPEVDNRNEVGMLARSVEKMSLDLRDYMDSLLTKEKELARMSAAANRDELTRVGNLSAYTQYAENLQLRMTEEKLEYAIVMADVDDLKKQNTAHGHDRGNQYLKNCCAVICDVFRHSPVFRIGGDEFAVVLIGEDYQNRRELLRDARERFRRSWINEDVAPWERLSVTLGAADYQDGADKTVEDVLRRADHAMYEARKLKE